MKTDVVYRCGNKKVYITYNEKGIAEVTRDTFEVFLEKCGFKKIEEMTYTVFEEGLRENGI